MNDKMTDKDRPPFFKSIGHLQNVLDVDLKTAMEKVQAVYSDFKGRNQRLIERQNDQSNAAQVQLISHFALLATLTLTVIGFLVTQNTQSLTSFQKIIILNILFLEIVSIFFGAMDYVQTIRFHMRWAKLHQNIDREVDDRLNSGTLQWTRQLNEIEARHLESLPESTKLWVTVMMIATCLLGLVLLLVLFYAFFF